MQTIIILSACIAWLYCMQKYCIVGNFRTVQIFELFELENIVRNFKYLLILKIYSKANSNFFRKFPTITVHASV